MKSVMNVVGILFVIFGIVVLAYSGFTYKTENKIAEIGSVKITSDETRHVSIPPALGGLAFFAGIIILVISRPTRR